MPGYNNEHYIYKDNDDKTSHSKGSDNIAFNRRTINNNHLDGDAIESLPPSNSVDNTPSSISKTSSFFAIPSSEPLLSISSPLLPSTHSQRRHRHHHHHHHNREDNTEFSSQYFCEHQRQQHHHHHSSPGKMFDPQKDLLDGLPPEIIDQILSACDNSILFQCVVLSRRWSSRVIPHLWYRPWVMYYISWVRLLRMVKVLVPSSLPPAPSVTTTGTIATATTTATDVANTGNTTSGKKGGIGDSGRTARANAGVRDVGKEIDPQCDFGIGLIRLGDEKKNKDDEEAVIVEEGIYQAVGGIMATTSTSTAISTMSLGIPDAHIRAHAQQDQKTPLFSHPPALSTYGSMIRILDFSHLYYILNDQLLSHLLPYTPHLQELLIASPKQFSDEGLMTVARCCPDLLRLELCGCTKVSDKGMAAVFDRCWELKTVVLSNIVVQGGGQSDYNRGGGSGGSGSSGSSGSSGGSGGSGGMVGNVSRASSSNSSLVLTHKTLDCLAKTSPTFNPPFTTAEDLPLYSSSSSLSSSPIILPSRRKLHTLNLANGLRCSVPSSIDYPIDPITSKSLQDLLTTYRNTLVSVNISFLGAAVSDHLLSSAFSTSLLHLSLAFCHEVTDAGLCALVQSSPSLQVLDITGVFQITDKAILAVGYGCPKFQTLVMVDERHRTTNPTTTNHSTTTTSTITANGASWRGQNIQITEKVLSRFPWGVRTIQRRKEVHHHRRPSRIF